MIPAIVATLSGARRWTPALLPSLVRWYDASRESGADSATLATITDRSGAGANGTASGSPKIRTHAGIQIAGRNVLEFDGASHYAFTATTGTTVNGWWAVVRARTTVAKLFATSASTSNYLGLAPLTSDVTWSANSRADEHTGGAAGRILLLIGSRNGSTRAIWCNGATLSLQVSNMLATDAFSLSQLGGYTTYRWVGDIAEFGMTTAELSAGQIATLANYLQAKWAPRKLVICDGNSLTLGEGYGATRATSYPAVMQASLGAAWEVCNLGVAGQTIAQMAGDFSAQVGSLWAYRSRNVYVAWEFANSLTGRTSAEAQSDFNSLCATARAAGYTVVALTITAAAVTGTTDATWQTRRTECNTWLRDSARLVANGGNIDAVCDVAADAAFAVGGSAGNPTYYSDTIHLSAAGYAVVAALVESTLAAL